MLFHSLAVLVLIGYSLSNVTADYSTLPHTVQNNHKSAVHKAKQTNLIALENISLRNHQSQ